MVLLPNCSIAKWLPAERMIRVKNNSTIQQFNNSTIQQFNNSTIQQFNNFKVDPTFCWRRVAGSWKE
jgi:hypothetical protein